MNETIVHGPTFSQVFSVGSFRSRLPKLVAAWPAAGRTSSPPSTVTAAIVNRVLSFGIFDPFEIGAAYSLTIVKLGPIRFADWFPAASRAPARTLYLPGARLRELVRRPW